MLHSNIVEPFQRILYRIENTQKQHKQRLVFQRQKIELIVYNFCRIVEIPLDVMQLVIIFYVNVRFLIYADLYGFVCISNLYKYSYTASMGFDITYYDGTY